MGAKYKVGDKVRVLPVNERNGKRRQQGLGTQTFTITRVNYSAVEADAYYHGDEKGWGVWEDNLALAEPVKTDQRAKITNKETGQFLTGKVAYVGGPGLDIIVDGTKTNAYVQYDEWDIEPIVELPKAINSYIRVRSTGSEMWSYYRRTGNQSWFGSYLTLYDAEIIKRYTDIEVLFVPEAE